MAVASQRSNDFEASCRYRRSRETALPVWYVSAQGRKHTYPVANLIDALLAERPVARRDQRPADDVRGVT